MTPPQLTDAQSDITAGATVLLIDALDSGVGDPIETYAKSHGVDVIDYDRLVLGGSRQYYVSFDNVQVGKLIGQGMVSCIAAGRWPSRKWPSWTAPRPTTTPPCSPRATTPSSPPTSTPGTT